MFKFLSNAMLSLIMEKPARDKLKARRQVARAAGGKADRDRQIRDLQQTAQQVMTPERQELIRQAMRVQRAKQKVLDDLNDEDKRRLYALAVKQLLREDDKGGGPT